ncbi:MAG: ABC transporter ATP-binding protein [Breznakia sp.]
MSILSVKNLTKNFGGLQANSNINLEVCEDELIGLIGPNGAGKTTLFNMLTGVYEPSEGEILFFHHGKLKSIAGKKPYAINKMGIARTFQNIRLFKSMSVLDNVKVAMHQNVKYHVWSAMLRLPKYYKEEARIEKESLALLEIFDLHSKADELASNLPYGEQRRLEIARALACKPTLLFLDEPAAGMNPQETAELCELIRFVKEKFQISVVLIEHDMSLVMNLCERIYVLDYGKMIANGTPEEIASNKRVIEAYLGEDVG